MEKETIYLMTDRYEHAEFYDFYGDGIYTDRDKALADLKGQYYKFVKYGPDDCHTFRLTKHELIPEMAKRVRDYYNMYEESHNDPEGYTFNYMKEFTQFMENLMDLTSTETLFESDGCSDVFEIMEMAEKNGEDWEDDAVFAKYFEIIWNKDNDDGLSFCPDCGRRIDDSDKECPNCGRKVEA